MRSLARLLIAFSRASIIGVGLPVLVWSNTHHVRGDCIQPNYIVIVVQTEDPYVPAVTSGSYPRSIPASPFSFKCSLKNEEPAFAQCRCCSYSKWAIQEVSSSLGFQGLGLLLHPWAPVALSQSICLQVVKCWFTVWDEPWFPERFALSQYWFVSVKRVLVTGWGEGWGVVVGYCLFVSVCQSTACIFMSKHRK